MVVIKRRANGTDTPKKEQGDSTASSKSTSRETAVQDVPPEPDKGGRCSGVLKYIVLVLLVPAFLNHAALYREAIGLKPQGELYDIGFGQKMFMGCVGQGKPTIILDAPTGMSSDAWTLVVPKLARISTVCFFDRAGLGFSDRPFINRSKENVKDKNRGAPSTTERMTEDFHRLFTASSTQAKPFILVGSEIGAANARFYAQLFEDRVAGLILINPLIEDMFIGERYPWTGLWLRNHISGLQALQFSAAIGVSRLAFIFGLMKTPINHTIVADDVTARQKYLMCKPGHLSSAVDEYFFANESLSQLKTLSKLKRFDPNNVKTSVLISKTYNKRADDVINKEWQTAKGLVEKFFSSSGAENFIHLPGSADAALFEHSKTIASVIEKHVKIWRMKKNPQQAQQNIKSFSM
ncbi:uncharacterized protein LOC116298853 [Actinia tenebrosa]|uniref:Uncharacterized protein LOC116298853 n=1 Tax=Actinia tenebrosa TaxID=6105 RepID=A0A6P8I3Z1_ACTTE|nr:uncharacterized protein LOC116298853 [Actinia tenebrosa]